MGKLLAGLKAEGLDDNTLVIFLGDNGTGGDGKGTVSELGAACRASSAAPASSGASYLEVQAARASFADILAKLPEPKPRDGLTPRSQKQSKAERKQKKEGGSAGNAVPQSSPDRVARFGQCDKNDDGLLSQEEFMSTLAGSDQAAGEVRFKKLDTNRDGQLTKDEFLGATGTTK